MSKKLKILSCLGFFSVLITGCFGYSTAKEYETLRLKSPNSVVVCRSKQCAPSKLSMSSEYIFNSLAHLLNNNNRQKALICEADAGSHTCIENFITIPIRVGITPAHMYIDSVKFTDVTLTKGMPQLNLVLDYNVTFNGQYPTCNNARSIMYVKNSDNIVLEDGGYECKMTTMGSTTVKTLFLVDYIDLDYGYIGGFYSIGLNGPANGGGTGYMMIRLAKDAYPLSSNLQAPTKKTNLSATSSAKPQSTSGIDLDSPVEATNGVQIFPMKR